MSTRNHVFPPSISHWEIEQNFKRIDLVIVGSGIVGLTTAIFFKQKHPEKRVLIVERGFLPSGASTKNAGFACFGSLSEILSDLKHSSLGEVIKLMQKRVDGLKMLRHLVGDRKVDYQPCGGFEVFTPSQNELFKRSIDFLPSINEQLEKTLNLKHTYSDETDQISAFGFNGISNLIFNQHEGCINTGKMMAELLRLARSLGITILNALEVTDWNDKSSSITLSFANGLEVEANQLHFATNGFASQLLPDLDVAPARAQVLITSPISDLKVRGTFHIDEGFFYFRNVGNRLLLGGGRNLDIEGETTSEMQISRLIQGKLDELLSQTILPDSDYTIEHRWAGIMGVGQQKRTIIKRLSDNVSCSVRLGGMGVAIGTSIGKESAELIAQNKSGDKS
jgi:hypothetical protein